MQGRPLYGRASKKGTLSNQRLLPRMNGSQGARRKYVRLHNLVWPLKRPSCHFLMQADVVHMHALRASVFSGRKLT
jgi:hypothetical protein